MIVAVLQYQFELQLMNEFGSSVPRNSGVLQCSYLSELKKDLNLHFQVVQAGFYPQACQIPTNKVKMEYFSTWQRIKEF